MGQNLFFKTTASREYTSGETLTYFDQWGSLGPLMSILMLLYMGKQYSFCEI